MPILKGEFHRTREGIPPVGITISDTALRAKFLSRTHIYLAFKYGHLASAPECTAGIRLGLLR